jgi:hypothetical protein
MTKYETIPTQYTHLINQEEYTRILEISQDYLSQYGYINGLENGVILFIDSNSETNRFALDNLIRKLNGQDSKIWEEMIKEHFYNFFNNSESKYDFNDLNQIKDILVIRIYPDGYFEAANFQDKIVYRVDFEDTKSTLVYDLPDKFQPVEQSEFKNWNISIESAFKIALDNVNRMDVEISKQNHENGFELYSFFSGDFSASFLLDLKGNANFTIGKYGSLVSIPTKGSAFVHPINHNDIALVLGDIHDMVIKFYDEDPGPISVNYYWYFHKKFMKFPVTRTEQGFRTYHLPIELDRIFKEK